VDKKENEQWMLAYCPSFTESVSVEEWYALANDKLPAPMSLEDFRATAEDLARRGQAGKSQDRFFDPQKTIRHGK